MSSLKLRSVALVLVLAALANAEERNIHAAYRDTNVRIVVQQVGQVTQSPVLIERGVEGNLTFVTNGPVTPGEFRSAVESALDVLATESPSEMVF